MGRGEEREEEVPAVVWRSSAVCPLPCTLHELGSWFLTLRRPGPRSAVLRIAGSRGRSPHQRGRRGEAVDPDQPMHLPGALAHRRTGLAALGGIG
jgi:hypothetical protein